MQQRARMLGGDLVAAPTEQGFMVSARLPVDDADRKPLSDTGHGRSAGDPDLQLVEGGVP